MTCAILALIVAFESSVLLTLHACYCVTVEKLLPVHDWKSDAWLRM